MTLIKMNIISHYTSGILLVGLFILGCKEEPVNEINAKEKISNISQLIDSLYSVDQEIQIKIIEASQNREQQKVKGLILEEQNIFKRHIPILKDIYKSIGYPTSKLVGKESSTKFFTLVQHSDADVKFQEQILNSIAKEFKSENVAVQDYAFLTDRVQLALKGLQVYGTQIRYNTSISQAFPKSLVDSVNVNKRRNEIGLEPIEEYLNKASQSHFQMNEKHYDEIGIKEPKLYEIE